MRKRWVGTVTILLLMVFAVSSRVLAQSAAPTGTGMLHELSGVWNAGGGARAAAPGDAAAPPPAALPQATVAGPGGVPVQLPAAQMQARQDAAAGVPKMTPWAQAKYDYNTHELKNDRPITIDPAYNCHPAGLPHAFANGAFPWEMVQTPQRIFIFYESAHLWREIWMDGRKMPEGGDPLWMGYSIGHWDGDDLVVDTENFNDLTWLDAAGHPHSDQMKLTERFHRPDHDHLQIVSTINDPKAYTAPYVMRSNWLLKPTWEIGEAFCVPEDQSNFEKNILAPNGKSGGAKKAAAAPAKKQ